MLPSIPIIVITNRKPCSKKRSIGDSFGVWIQLGMRQKVFPQLHSSVLLKHQESFYQEGSCQDAVTKVPNKRLPVVGGSHQEGSHQEIINRKPPGNPQETIRKPARNSAGKHSVTVRKPSSIWQETTGKPLSSLMSLSIILFLSPGAPAGREDQSSGKLPSGRFM